MLQAEASILPDISSLLHKMRNAAMFSVTDLSCAYYSFRITEDSRWLTTFHTCLGSFQYLSMPTGIAVACQSFSQVSQKMLHERVVLDNNGKPIYDAPNVVRMEPDPIDGCESFFDDICVFTPAHETYAETVRAHYQKIEKVISRLAFHDARISFEKSNFGKFKISFLGWHISHNFIMANPKRLQKIKDTPFPVTVKGLRGFIGLINSLRLCLNFQHLENVRYLTPLTSNKLEYKPTDFHPKVFEDLKLKLLEKPIFSNMIDPRAKKVLFTDASPLDSSSYSCCLGQIIEPRQDEVYIPPHLTLDDEVHRIVFDNKLIYQPIPLITSEQEAKQFFSSLTKTVPPVHNYLLNPLLGFTENNWTDSFFISIQSIMFAYRCKVLSISEMRKLTLSQIKKTVLRLKIKDFIFGNSSEKMKKFLTDFSAHAPVDNLFLAIEAFAYASHRPIIVISSLPKDKERPIITFNGNIVKPPFVVGVYIREGKTLFLPFFVNRQSCFDLSKLKNKFEIVAYHSRSLPQSTRGKAILDHELYAILSSVESMKKYIGGSEVVLLTDSKPLYFLFHKDVHRSNVRLYRWSLKLRVENPNLQLEYIPSAQNLADFLSKRYDVLPGDLPRVSLKNLDVEDLSTFIPPHKVFTVSEWAQWVQENPQYLKELSNKTKATISSLSVMAKNIEKHVKPLSAMEKRMSYDQIQLEQRKELTEMYERCLTAKDFTLYLDVADNGSDMISTVKMINGLLFVMDKETPQILLPSTLVGLFIAFYHLSTGHGGIKKMTAALSLYYFQDKNKWLTHFISRCYVCQISNRNTRKEKMGVYPLPDYPFEIIHLDLIENIGKSGLYEHILIVTCPLSDITLLFPLKNKSASEVGHILLYSILQYFKVRKILCDNAPCFSSKQLLSLLSTIGVDRLVTSALNPASKGLIESKVKIVKNIMKKLLSTHSTFNWEGLPYIAAKLLNTTKSNKTGVAPYNFLFGAESEHSKEPFTQPILPRLHPIIQGKQYSLQEQQIELFKTIADAKGAIKTLRTKQVEKANKTRIHKTFNPNDIVFCLDRSHIQNHSRPLKTVYSKSPYIVLNTYPVTTLVKRLSDGFTQVYSNNDLKLYNKLDPKFMDLPSEVLEIIKNDATELDKIQLDILAWLDPFDVPMGTDLALLTEKGIPPEYTNDESVENNQNNLSSMTPNHSEDLLNSVTSSNESLSSHLKESKDSSLNNNKQVDSIDPSPAVNAAQTAEISPEISDTAGKSRDKSSSQIEDEAESSDDDGEQDDDPIVLHSGKRVTLN